jgi:hypothetical protein
VEGGAVSIYDDYALIVAQFNDDEAYPSCGRDRTEQRAALERIAELLRHLGFMIGSSDIRVTRYLPLKLDGLQRLHTAIESLGKDDLAAAIKATLGNDDPCYLEQTWPQFDKHRVGYILSRQPCSQGEFLLNLAVERMVASCGC